MERKWWHPPHYNPTMDELKRCRERLIDDRIAKEGDTGRPMKERRGLWGHIFDRVGASGWPEHADPADLRRLGFADDEE